MKDLLLKIGLYCLLLGVLPSVDTEADQLSFAVSPSKVTDLVLDKGDSHELSFTVGNRSVFPSEDVDKFNLYNFKIEMFCEIENQYGVFIDSTGIVSFNKDWLSCRPKETDSVNVNLTIPDDFVPGSYTFYINFKRYPIEGLEDVGAVTYSVIQVPIYVFIGDSEAYSKLNFDYEIESLSVDFGVEVSTINNLVENNLKSLVTINPFKVVNNFKNILQSPVYVVYKKIGEEYRQFVDVNDNFMVNLNSVVTTKDVNDWKYVLVDDSQRDLNVSKINFDKGVEFILEDDSSVIIEVNEEIRNNVQEQLNSIVQEIEGSPKLSYLLDKLKVPVNRTYNLTTELINVNLVNTGDSDIHVDGKFSLTKDNMDLEEREVLSAITLRYNGGEALSIPISQLTFRGDGDYTLAGTFNGHDKVKNISHDFTMDGSIRYKIFGITLLVYVVVLTSTVILMISLYKLFKNKKNTNEEEDDLNKEVDNGMLTTA